MAQISFEGQVAIVTGSGAGLGRSYALELARRGAAVVVNDVARERAESTVAEIEQLGGRAVASVESVAEVQSARRIVEAALEAFGTVDALVNNAGTMRNAAFEEMRAEDLWSQLQVHVGGCFFVTQAAWPVMQEKGYGRVIMVSSAGGLWAMRGISNYSAAKGGVYGLGRALAREGLMYGILVNVLLPGAATTISSPREIVGYVDEFRPELRDAIGPRRVAESVAPVVAYLASSACDFTGETFSAVAGRYARVLVAVTEGWFAEDHLTVTAEDIAEHWAEICDPSTYYLPASLFDEYESIGPRLGVPPRQDRGAVTGARREP